VQPTAINAVTGFATMRWMEFVSGYLLRHCRTAHLCSQCSVPLRQKHLAASATGSASVFLPHSSQLSEEKIPVPGRGFFPFFPLYGAVLLVCSLLPAAAFL